MNKQFSLALIAQTLFTAAFFTHRFTHPLGSDVMFGVLIASLFVGVFLLWQSLRNASTFDMQKAVGIIFGCLPFLWLLLLILFVGNFKM
jgi:hypothetical protein